ncbi:hypothetical protein HDU76_002921 [Blyttiomyces sp. JEL0837]|nr:hypothetical protein HDU76_002921 [Blyttiomyces sp. JEL0837]
MFKLLISLLALLTVASHALPTGAPKCKINPQIIQTGHGINASNVGYTFDMPAYTPGGPAVPITINGGQAFKGILLYMTPGTTQDSTLAPNGVNAHVGTFMVNPGLRPQSASSCQAMTVMNDAPESTLTHAIPLLANTPYTLMWTPPAMDVGPVTMNAVISVGSKNSPWQVVPSKQMTSTAATADIAKIKSALNLTRRSPAAAKKTTKQQAQPQQQGAVNNAVAVNANPIIAAAESVIQAEVAKVAADVAPAVQSEVVKVAGDVITFAQSEVAKVAGDVVTIVQSEVVKVAGDVQGQIKTAVLGNIGGVKI